MGNLGIGLWVVSVLFLLAGWVMNLITLFSMQGFSGELFLRIIGVFMIPVGGILGYF